MFQCCSIDVRKSSFVYATFYRCSKFDIPEQISKHHRSTFTVEAPLRSSSNCLIAMNRNSITRFAIPKDYKRRNRDQAERNFIYLATDETNRIWLERSRNPRAGGARGSLNFTLSSPYARLITGSLEKERDEEERKLYDYTRL